MPRTNGDKIRESAHVFRVIGESVLSAIEDGDFTEDDLIWYQERVKSEAEGVENLVYDYFNQG